jgi:hypothetical protein
LAPVGPVMVIAEVIPKALAPEVLLPEVDRLMVAAPPAVRLAAKTMVSAPWLMLSLLALSMASRRESAPESLVFRTVKVAGTILPSSCRSCGRE